MADGGRSAWFVVALLGTTAAGVPVDAQSYVYQSSGSSQVEAVDRNSNWAGPNVKGMPGSRRISAARFNERNSEERPTSARLVRLPPVTPQRPPQANRPPDGTWREDGQYVVINLKGQEFRLVKSDPPANTIRPSDQVQPATGNVCGRLSHRGRPLVGCKVALVRIRKSMTGYKIVSSDEAELAMTVTDNRGVYHFANVLPGLYKLKWRPSGQESWIRRAELRPDVRVNAAKTTDVKEIRVALRTIN